ncbi:hypothetical protein FPOA_05708 [Fusarium poae]|uniref:Uncharacterized protein n=1 Tax=Fusarium poae TaxID=36050 RepID=A0A1B8AXC7_FUSPO|nr:hypothetical protein FPOA_05708 [Fusarium poae]
MASSSKSNSPPAGVRKIKREHGRSQQKLSSSSSSSSSPVTPSETTSTTRGYETPGSTFSKTERDAPRSGRSTPSGRIPCPSLSPSSNKRNYRWSKLSSISSSHCSLLNNESSSDEGGLSHGDGIYEVQEGKNTKMPKDLGSHNKVSSDILKWMKSAIELKISDALEIKFHPLLDKLAEEVRMRCETDAQLKSVTVEKEEALRAHSELKAHTAALEEKLKKSEEDLRELQETQVTKRVLHGEYQGVKQYSNKNVNEHRRISENTSEVTKENIIYLEDRWNKTAKEREEVRDQATEYKTKNTTLEKNKVKLETDNYELTEQLKASKYDTLRLRWDLEEVEKRLNRCERDNATLKQEKVELEKDNVSLVKQRDEFVSEAANKKVSQVQASTQTDSANQNTSTTTEGNYVATVDWKEDAINHSASQDGDEASSDVPVHEEETQENHREEYRLESDQDKEHDFLEYDALLKHSEESLERLLATNSDEASERDAEPGTNEQQRTNEFTAQGDATVTETPADMILTERQVVPLEEPVPQSHTPEVPVHDSKRRRNNKVSKIHKHRLREDEESIQQKDARRHHRSRNSKKQHIPASRTHRTQKQERVVTQLAWVKCLKHPRSFLKIYYNMKGIFDEMCKAGRSGRVC